RLEAAHDQFKQPIAHALAVVELVQIVADGAIKRLFDTIHRLADAGAVIVRHWPIGGVRQFRQRHLTPRTGCRQRQRGAGQITAKSGVEQNGHETYEVKLSCVLIKARLDLGVKRLRPQRARTRGGKHAGWDFSWAVAPAPPPGPRFAGPPCALEPAASRAANAERELARRSG